MVVLGKVITFDSAIFTFWTDVHLLEFVIGLVIYFMYKKGVFSVLKRNSTVFIIIEILMLFAGKYILGNHFSIIWNMVWGTCLLATSLMYGNGKCNRFLVMLGNISYSMYMIHFLIVGFVARILIDNHVYSIANTLMVVLTIIAVIPVSYIVYRIMEVYLPIKIKCGLNL